MCNYYTIAVWLKLFLCINFVNYAATPKSSTEAKEAEITGENLFQFPFKESSIRFWTMDSFEVFTNRNVLMWPTMYFLKRPFWRK